MDPVFNLDLLGFTFAGGLSKAFYSGLLWITLDWSGLLWIDLDYSGSPWITLAGLRSELWRRQSSEIFGDRHFLSQSKREKFHYPNRFG